MKESINLLDEKMKILENLESELESGIKRNARDKTDYLLQMRALQLNTEKAIASFKEQLSDH